MSPALLAALAAVRELGAQLDDEVPGMQALVDRIEAAERGGKNGEAWRLTAILLEAVSTAGFPSRSYL